MACGKEIDPPKFAFVRFLVDDVRAVVEVADIKRFKPKDCKDFPPERPYWVLWANGKKDEEDFYKAQILKLAATKEELERQVAASRVRVPKVIDTSIEESTEDEDAVDSEVGSVTKVKAQKKKMMQKSARPSQPLKNVLESRINGKRESPLFTSTPLKRVHEEVESENEQCMRKKIAHLRNELSSSQEEVVKLNKKISEVRAELSQCKTTNKRLQNALLLKIEASVTGSKSEGNCRKSPPLQSQHIMSEAMVSKESPSPLEDDPEEKDGMVHLGADIWIAKEKWEDISAQSKHSMFVKNLLVAIWGSSVLKERSLDGKVCPRFKNEREAKPALTPVKVAAMKKRFSKRLDTLCGNTPVRNLEASRFNKYISEKLQDVSRKRGEPQQTGTSKATDQST